MLDQNVNPNLQIKIHSRILVQKRVEYVILRLHVLWTLNLNGLYMIDWLYTVLYPIHIILFIIKHHHSRWKTTKFSIYTCWKLFFVFIHFSFLKAWYQRSFFKERAGIWNLKWSLIVCTLNALHLFAQNKSHLSLFQNM